jgi:hypothetical protein
MTDPETAKQLHQIQYRLAENNASIMRNSGYLARAEMRQILAGLARDPFRLEPYGYKVYSQNDEDGILVEIFKRLGIERGTFCEIGVESGLECNSLFLIHQGWRGLWIEGDYRQAVPIQAKFQSILDNRRLGLKINVVSIDNVNDLITEELAALDIRAADLDFLSIDIDGMDIYLLEALQIHPKVICVEYNSKFPPPVSKRPAYNPTRVWQGSDYMGSSLVALTDAALAKGYKLVGTNITGGNAFFVRADLVGDRFGANLTPDYLYNPPRYYLTLDHFMTQVGHRADFGPYDDLE